MWLWAHGSHLACFYHIMMLIAQSWRTSLHGLRIWWILSDIPIWEVSEESPLRLGHVEAVDLGLLMDRWLGAARLVGPGKHLLCQGHRLLLEWRCLLVVTNRGLLLEARGPGFGLDHMVVIVDNEEYLLLSSPFPNQVGVDGALVDRLACCTAIHFWIITILHGFI